MTIGYMVRCKCGVLARIDAPAEPAEDTRTRRVLGVRGWIREQYTIRVKRLVVGSYMRAAVHEPGAIPCWTCGGFLSSQKIEGVISKVHVCSAKCVASKGPYCECSCGGANHGQSYAA